MFFGVDSSFRCFVVNLKRQKKQNKFHIIWKLPTFVSTFSIFQFDTLQVSLQIYLLVRVETFLEAQSTKSRLMTFKWNNLLEGIQQAFYVVCRLVLQDFYAAFHLKINRENRSIIQSAAVTLFAQFKSCTYICVCLTSILEDLLKAPFGWTWS